MRKGIGGEPLVTKEDRRRAVYELIKDNPGIDAYALRNETGYRMAHVVGALSSLFKQGKTHVEKRGERHFYWLAGE